MQVTTKAIVLSALKYGDTSLIVRAFTASDGLKAYLLKGVLASRKGKVKAAYFLPLTQLEIVANHRNRGTLESIREVKVHYPYQSLHTNVAKNAMTLFLAEVLGNCVREEEENRALFQFLEASLQWLDTHNEISNFHIYFLLALTRFLGFYPDTEAMGAPFFDLMEGEFIEAPTVNPMLQKNELKYFKAFLGTNFDTVHTIRMNKTDRQAVLKSLLLYFELHLQGFKKPRSLAVLNEVFG